jgi:hypothetical protein
MRILIVQIFLHVRLQYSENILDSRRVHLCLNDILKRLAFASYSYLASKSVRKTALNVIRVPISLKESIQNKQYDYFSI